MLRKVLLIDDDRLQFRLTQAHFEKFQTDRYELDWADTYEGGLTRLCSGEYAACLLDFQLGERDGLQLIREAVARECRTPIVFLTAEAADRIDIEAMNAGALDYLVKGEITPRLIERALRYALKLAETLAALRELATHDALTGLLNRREFDRILAEEVERADRFGQPLALVTIDVDHFKRINDTHGHPAGDAVLREVARRLGSLVRTADRVARIGGEEFAIVLVQAGVEAAEEVAGRICRLIRETAFPIGATVTLSVTASVGVAACPRHATTATGLLSASDRALYRAKQDGRDRVVRCDG